jgi:ABC-type polysaccharide/polyol phosphate transport system ATPase subunit
VTVPPVRVEALWEAYRTRNRFGWRQRGGEHWALRDVDLTVDRCGALGVIGGNGSGKTTLLQVLAGVLEPTRGRVVVEGRTASLVDLSAGFHRDLTGHENLRIGAVLLGLSRRELRRRYDDIVAFTGLPARALDAPLASYSAGMGLRLGFSLVVNSDPDVLLVDEVLAVGDESFQRRCVERVDQLRGGGCAVVIVSHDLDLVRAHCDRVAVLDAGQLTYLGDPDGGVEHYRRHRHDPPPEAPEDARLFESSWRVQAARRRRGV